MDCFPTGALCPLLLLAGTAAQASRFFFCLPHNVKWFPWASVGTFLSLICAGCSWLRIPSSAGNSMVRPLFQKLRSIIGLIELIPMGGNPVFAHCIALLPCLVGLWLLSSVCINAAQKYRNNYFPISPYSPNLQLSTGHLCLQCSRSCCSHHGELPCCDGTPHKSATHLYSLPSGLNASATARGRWSVPLLRSSPINS